MKCKVEIGSKYEGPCWDKPALRAMPREWRLEEQKVSWFLWVLIALFRLIRG